MKQKKPCCLTNESQFLFKPQMFLKNRTSKDLSVEATRYSKCNWTKSGIKFVELRTKVSKFPNVLYFQQHRPNFGPFPKVTLIRNTKGSRLKRVATGRVSERYQIPLIIVCTTLLENLNFALKVQT